METSTESLTRTLADKASSQIDRASVTAQEAVGQAADAAQVAAQAAGRRLGVAKEQLAIAADRWTETTREYVRRNPFASIGVAMGVAVSLALGAEFLYRHRDRDLSEHRHH